MKKEKIKKIIFIVSIILNVLYTLILVLSLSSVKKNKTQSVSAVDNQLTDLSYTRWRFNDYVVLPQEDVSWNINFSSNQHSYNILKKTYNHIDFAQLKYEQVGGITTPVYTDTGSGVSWLHDWYKDIFIFDGEDVFNSSLIHFLYENATLQSEFTIYGDFKYNGIFTFNKNFNYNAPYSRSTDSTFIVDGNYNNSTSLIIKSLYVGQFVSNHNVFDTLKLYYLSGDNTRYIDETNLVKVASGSQLGYYIYMEYYYSKTGYTKMVNYRDYVSRNDSNNNTQTCVVNNALWVNNEYQNIYFIYDLSVDSSNNLTKFNNYDVYNGINTYDDTGIGSAFNLLTLSFSSLIPLLSIQILPNITIGLLLFMPLIVGIIIFVIWLVKR